jgi:choline-glycine betaine transporter
MRERERKGEKITLTSKTMKWLNKVQGGFPFLFFVFLFCFVLFLFLSLFVCLWCIYSSLGTIRIQNLGHHHPCQRCFL